MLLKGGGAAARCGGCWRSGRNQGEGQTRPHVVDCFCKLPIKSVQASLPWLCSLRPTRQTEPPVCASLGGLWRRGWEAEEAEERSAAVVVVGGADNHKSERIGKTATYDAGLLGMCPRIRPDFEYAFPVRSRLPTSAAFSTDRYGYILGKDFSVPKAL